MQFAHGHRRGVGLGENWRRWAYITWGSRVPVGYALTRVRRSRVPASARIGDWMGCDCQEKQQCNHGSSATHSPS